MESMRTSGRIMREVPGARTKMLSQSMRTSGRIMREGPGARTKMINQNMRMTCQTLRTTEHLHLESEWQDGLCASVHLVTHTRVMP